MNWQVRVKAEADREKSIFSKWAMIAGIIVIIIILLAVLIASRGDGTRKQASDIATIYLEKNGQKNYIKNLPVYDNDYLPAQLSFTDKLSGKYLGFENRNVLVKIRGNSTRNTEKKSYNVKFETKTPLLGMKESKKWVLLANAFDPTLLRNKIAFDLASKVGLAHTPEAEYFELYCDGKYNGNYLLTKKPSGKNIGLKCEEGDFLIDTCIDYFRVEPGKYLVLSGMETDNLRFEIAEPDEITSEVKSHIRDTVRFVEEEIESRDWDRIQGVIDVDSFVLYYVFNEYMKTVDFGKFSTMYYYKNGKMYAGPIWDYDLAMGNYSDYYELGDESYNDLYCDNAAFYGILCQMPQFQQLIREKYAQISNLFDEVYETWIDALIEENREFFARNYDQKLTNYRVNQVNSEYMRVPMETYEENVEYLREWLRKRKLFLDSIWSE